MTDNYRESKRETSVNQVNSGINRMSSKNPRGFFGKCGEWPTEKDLVEKIKSRKKEERVANLYTCGIIISAVALLFLVLWLMLQIAT